MDKIRLKNGIKDEQYAEYLSQKYKSVQFSAIITDSTKASQFIEQYGEALFGKIPSAHYSSSQIIKKFHKISLTPGIGDAVEKTIEMAFKPNNRAKSIIIIGGNNLSSQRITEQLF